MAASGAVGLAQFISTAEFKVNVTIDARAAERQLAMYAELLRHYGRPTRSNHFARGGVIFARRLRAPLWIAPMPKSVEADATWRGYAR